MDGHTAMLLCFGYFCCHLTTHEKYMLRCIELAKLGVGNVAPNPMVGAVLVHEGNIIGEGYHQQFGQAHAEVNCINSVKESLRPHIPNSTLYVSLEPCSHFGKTPPCSDLIIQQQIKKVVVGCSDPFEQVNGKGIEKLRAANVEVIVDILKDECLQLNKRFFAFHTKKRPYIILKWAQTANGKMASSSNERLLITNDFTNRLVHKWRSEETAILVGTNTALLDNPSLNNRLWHGNNPIRLVIDRNLKLPASLNIFNQEQKTIVFNSIKDASNDRIYYCKIEAANTIEQVLQICYELSIQSILVEGGSKLLQSFINENLWDEARIITNESLNTHDGLTAPLLNGILIKEEKIFSDSIQYYLPPHDK
jgi:diaminohydroxyphosphoribosylaminopyrimidine deaminase/5-amino-6-(5-phosphoribosylamino)uracil reductase